MEEEKKELQEDVDVWRDSSKREESWTKYYKDKWEDEERHSNWMANHIRELDADISALKNRPLWKWIWNDIKPKRKYTDNHYAKEYRRKGFLGKMFRVLLAVAYAVMVAIGVSLINSPQKFLMQLTFPYRLIP